MLTLVPDSYAGLLCVLNRGLHRFFPAQEGVLTLVRLYQQLLFRLTPGQVPLKTKVTLTHGPAEGVWVTVHRRE